MCGRYLRRRPAADYAALLGVGGDTDTDANLPASYNVAPSQTVPAALLDDTGRRRLAALRWGLVPSWSGGPDKRYSMINARAETAAAKPAYRSACSRRRCLLPADGFYEWRKTPAGKQPYCIGLAGAEPFAFAGLWEVWQGGDDQQIRSCAILTTAANPLVADIHDRMPVILAPADYRRWLDHGRWPEDLLRPYPAELMDAYPVTTAVNNVRNNRPELAEPLRV